MISTSPVLYGVLCTIHLQQIALEKNWWCCGGARDDLCALLPLPTSYKFSVSRAFFQHETIDICLVRDE